MKIVKNILNQSFVLYILSTIGHGIVVRGGLPVFLWAGFILALCAWILRPILHVITLPIAFLTFGFSRVLTNAFILFILTKIVPEVSIKPFVLSRVEWFGFVIPALSFNYLEACIVLAVCTSILHFFILWVAED